ncbi:hypothetical protein WA171_001009 [Blastocystis sp. BT1]
MGTRFSQFLASFKSRRIDPLHCSLCHSERVLPISLICGHQFCSYCLMQWKQTNQKCPICHRMIEENEESSTNEIIIRALTEKCMSPELRAKFQTIFFGEGESIHKAYSGFIHSFLYIPTSEIKPILDQIEELLKLKIYESRPCLLFGCSFGSMQQFHELCDLFQNPALNDGVYWSVFLQPITDQDVSTMDLGKGFIQDLLSIDRRKLLCINSIVFIWRKYPNFKLQRVTDAISNMDDEKYESFRTKVISSRMSNWSDCYLFQQIFNEKERLNCLKRLLCDVYPRSIDLTTFKGRITLFDFFRPMTLLEIQLFGEDVEGMNELTDTSIQKLVDMAANV